jgi:hypothetical protein
MSAVLDRSWKPKKSEKGENTREKNGVSAKKRLNLLLTYEAHSPEPFTASREKISVAAMLRPESSDVI